MSTHPTGSRGSPGPLPEVSLGEVASTQLPESILHHIFGYLDSQSISSCLRVSHQFYQLASDNIYRDITLDTESFPGIFVGAALVTGAGSPSSPLRSTKPDLLSKVRSVTLTTHTHDQCEAYTWAALLLPNVKELWVVQEEISRWEVKTLCASITPCSFFHSLAPSCPHIGFANIFGDQGIGVTRSAKCVTFQRKDGTRTLVLPPHDQFLLSPHISFEISPLPEPLSHELDLPPNRAGFPGGAGVAAGVQQGPLALQGAGQAPGAPLANPPGNQKADFHIKADLSVFLRRFPSLSPRTLELHFLQDGRSLRHGCRLILNLLDLFDSPTPHIDKLTVLFTPMEKVRGMVQHPSTCKCIACQYTYPVMPRADLILTLRALRHIGRNVRVYGLETVAVALNDFDHSVHKQLSVLKRKEDDERRHEVLEEVKNATTVMETLPPSWLGSITAGGWLQDPMEGVPSNSFGVLKRAWGASNEQLGQVTFHPAQDYRSDRHREVGEGW